jgi:hypothetical protein
VHWYEERFSRRPECANSGHSPITGQIAARFSNCSCDGDATAAKLMHKLLKKQGFTPEVLVTDKPRSPGEAKTEIGLSVHHEQGLRNSNRAPPSRRRERKIQRFKIARISRALSVHHAAIQNNFHVSHDLASRRALDLLRDEAYPTWRPFTRPESKLGLPNCARPNSLEVKAG